MTARVPRPAVLDRIPRPFAVLEASAGTGKTYALEHLVVDRVLQGAALDRILVVTFTEKAALELRSRIRSLLNRLLSGPGEGAAEGPCWILDGTARKRLREARAALERATVATIHSFCQRALQESALERGSLFDQTQADGPLLFDRAWRDLLRGDLAAAPEHRALLREALEAGWTVEGLGELLYEVHRERARTVPEGEAAEAHRKRFPAGLDPRAIAAGWAAAKVHASTLKAAQARLEPFLALMDRSAFGFAQGLQDLGFDSLRKASAKEGLEGGAAAFAAWCRDFEPPTPESVLVRALLPPVQARLEALKASEGLFDFDDMILRVRDALAGPGGEALAERLRARYDAAFIDECQDTDGAQWDIFRTLFHCEGRELVLVGDPKQAIYGFRGGDLPTYLMARDQLTAGQGAVDLSVNFRATAPLLRVCERIFSHPAFFTGAVAYAPVTCGRPALGLEDAQGVPLPPLRVVQIGELDGGARLWRRVATGLARELQELLSSGARFGPEGDRRPLRSQDAFVLVGTAAEGRLMAEALAEAGLPHAFFKQKGLFQTPEAEAWLHLLRAVADPRDPGRLARALLTPFFGASLPDLEGLRDPREDHPALQRLRAWGELARRRRFGELVEQVLRESAVAERLLETGRGDRPLTNLRHLGELLAQAAEARRGGLPQLIRQLRRWQRGLDFPPGEQGDLQRLEGREDAVQILTLHAAKGLEAPVVAVFAPKAGRVTALRRFHDAQGRRCLHLGASKDSPFHPLIEAEEAHEQERLMYVALTRAQARLLVPCFVVDAAAKSRAGEARHPRGALKVLNRVLRPLLEAGSDLEISVVALAEVEGRAASVPPADVAPSASPILKAPALDADGLRLAARPRRTASFTALQRQAEEVRAQEIEDPEPDTLGAESGGLPRGPAVGTLLHELLEAVDPAGLRGRSFEGWWEDAAVRDPMLRRAALAGLGPEAAREAARRVFLGFATPLPLMDGAAPLAEADRLLREMDFLTGWPGGSDFLGGSVDALFEKEGRVYLLDWKSNGLPDYGPEALEACVSAHYALQVRIYTLAALRFLGVADEAAYEARFGGVRYIFLRGLPEGGIWSFRPAWAEVRAWERDLAALGREARHG